MIFLCIDAISRIKVCVNLCNLWMPIWVGAPID